TSWPGAPAVYALMPNALTPSVLRIGFHVSVPNTGMPSTSSRCSTFTCCSLGRGACSTLLGLDRAPQFLLPEHDRAAVRLEQAAVAVGSLLARHLRPDAVTIPCVGTVPTRQRRARGSEARRKHGYDRRMLFLLTGSAGSGKSAALAELARRR